MKKILFFCSVLLLVNCQSNQSKKSTEVNNSFVNLDGKKVAVSDYKGKRVLVNFWATWCGPCKAEMPSLVRAQEILKKENYVFLFPSDESIDIIKDFSVKTKYDFNFLKLNSSMGKIGIYALPTTFIYNEKGVKVKEIVGSVIWDSEEMIKTLKEI